MSVWRQFTHGLRALINRKSTDQEIMDEIDHYLEELTADFTRRGLPPDEARRAARLEMGGTALVREQVRTSGWENTVSTLLKDLRYATRRLIANPGYAV